VSAGRERVATTRFENIHDVGFYPLAAGWIVVVFANSGAITGSLMLVLGADILIARLPALPAELDALLPSVLDRAFKGEL